MDIKLVSDFRDYYDAAFALEGVPFERLTKNGMNRRAMLNYLDWLGFKTPVHGVVKDVVQRLADKFDGRLSSYGLKHIIAVVVYTDEMARGGEGKEVLTGMDALMQYPNHYCSEYIPTNLSGGGISLRYLSVGSRHWWVRFSSDHDWRSVVGTGQGEVLDICLDMPTINLPLYSIDFIPSGSTPQWAIDINTAPSLMPLKGIVPASEIYMLITEAAKSCGELTSESGCADMGQCGPFISAHSGP